MKTESMLTTRENVPFKIQTRAHPSCEVGHFSDYTVKHVVDIEVYAGLHVYS